MRTVPIAALSALLLCSCGPKALDLPAENIDRAATCGVVAAAEARMATDIKDSLPFEAQGRILHHTLLAGSTGEAFQPELATAVSRRMSELQEGITNARWQDLKPVCAAAYPEVGKTEVALPEGRFDAQLGCDALADFMLSALQDQEADYGNELAEYRQLRNKLNLALGPGMLSRVGSDIAAQQAARREALAGVAKLGTPTAVMRQCIERYG